MTKVEGKQPDYILLAIVVLLIIFGTAILASVSASYSLEKVGNTYYFLQHQLLFGLLPGLFFAFLVFKINLAFLKKITPILFLGSLILMAAVFLPIIGSGSRWIDLAGFSFQPSELLKLCFILYLASWLASKTEKINLPQVSKKSFFKLSEGFKQALVPFLIIIIPLVALLFFQSDISTLMIILFVGAVMYFSANTPFWHTILIFFIGIGGLLSLINLASYRVERFLVFLNPNLDPMGISWQINQALIAIGTGGLTGVGLGMSVQKLGFLPQIISDSIFAVFSEETGFIGGIGLILLFLMFLWRGFKIAKKSKDKFCQLTALGITCWIIVQTFVNIGAMIGILPLTGIPLPFVSYGGSALIVEMIGVGILLNISKNS